VNQRGPHHPVFTAVLNNCEQPRTTYPDNSHAGGHRFESCRAHHLFSAASEDLSHPQRRHFDTVTSCYFRIWGRPYQNRKPSKSL
jgi:hypothetical protein